MKAANSNFSLRGIAFFTSVVFLLSLCCFHSGILAADVSEVYEEEFEVVVSERVSGDALKLAKRFYAGLGIFYGIPSDLDDVTVLATDYWYYDWYSCPITPEVKSGVGLSLKGGYFFSENFALELLFRYHFKYDLEGDYSAIKYFTNAYDRVTAALDGDAKGWDITLNPKYFPFGANILQGKIRPYVVGGIGFMSLKASGDAWAMVWTQYYNGSWAWRRIPYSFSEDESDLSGRIGAGCDWFLTDQFGIELELDYTMGFGDLDEVKIFTVGLNGLVAF